VSCDWRFFACGGMVLAFLLWLMFRAAREASATRGDKYRSAEGKYADCVSPVI
jgi:hypothetical protein